MLVVPIHCPPGNVLDPKAQGRLLVGSTLCVFPTLWLRGRSTTPRERIPGAHTWSLPDAVLHPLFLGEFSSVPVPVITSRVKAFLSPLSPPGGSTHLQVAVGVSRAAGLCGKKKRLYLSLERGEGREEERESNIDVQEKHPLAHASSGDMACNPVALTGNQTHDLSVCGMTPSPLGHIGQG